MEQHSKSAGKKVPVATVTAGESPATSGDESKRTREGTDWLTFVTHRGFQNFTSLKTSDIVTVLQFPIRVTKSGKL